jgi:hypothetical protein
VKLIPVPVGRTRTREGWDFQVSNNKPWKAASHQSPLVRQRIPHGLEMDEKAHRSAARTYALLDDGEGKGPRWSSFAFQPASAICVLSPFYAVRARETGAVMFRPVQSTSVDRG